LIAGLILILYPMIELVTPMNISGGVSKKTLVNTLEPLNAASFSNSSFQESFASYVNDQIGFFAFFVQLHNQLEYSLFGNIYTGDIVAGKEDYLFEQPYIDAYYGKDFLGINKIEKFGTTFKALQDSLAVRGKFIMMGMATGKAFFYPEYLPSQKVRDSTNHEYFLEEFKARGINHINFLPMFQKLKERYGDLLFPKYGIHWSHFSNFFVADTLVKYIETQTGWDLPNIQLKALNFSDEPLYYDNDISGSLNLFKEPKPDSMAYPDFQWEPKINKDTKKILIIGDSFGWELVERMRLGQDCFESMEFWYYNLTCYTTDSRLNHSDELPYLVRHRDLRAILDQYDAFLIIANEPNVASRGFKFPKQMLSTLQDPNYQPDFLLDFFIEEQIKNKRSWRKQMEEMAIENGISYEEMMDRYLHDRNFRF
jgi:hypothetical protein